MKINLLDLFNKLSCVANIDLMEFTRLRSNIISSFMESHTSNPNTLHPLQVEIDLIRLTETSPQRIIQKISALSDQRITTIRALTDELIELAKKENATQKITK